MQSLTINLFNKQQAWADIQKQAFPFISLWLKDGVRLVLTISQYRRTPAQNKRYWGKGVLAQITEQATVSGRQFAAEIWHEQFKRQFIGVIELPNGSVVGMSSKDLNTAEFSEFCTKVEAHAASELNVTFYELEQA